MRRKQALAAHVLAGLFAVTALPMALAGGAADPGITPTRILLGGTSPLTGPEAASASVARGAKAYFDWVNAKGGVEKRRIEYLLVDDAYDPAQTVEATRRLVEDEGVFAVVNALGTEHSLAVREYLNRRRVPQLFVGSGAATWGADARGYPWTIGFQPSHRAEGMVYGRFVARTMKRSRVGVLFQNDADGRELLRGLEIGLAGSSVRVVAALPYEATAVDVGPQVAELEAADVDVFALFATPRFAIQAYRFANRLRWRPLVLTGSVSAASNVMELASAGGRNRTVAGSLSVGFLKDPANPLFRQDPAMRRYRTILRTYARGASAADQRHVYGMAVAYETVRLLERLGANPTRAGLMEAARSITSPANPFLLPGISVRTGRDDAFPVEQVRLQRWRKGRWVPFGGLWESKKR